MNKSDPSGHNTGLCYGGIYGAATCSNVVVGNSFVDNLVLGPTNQVLNGFVSVANVGADAFISVSTVIAPHGPMLDNMAMTTPIPGDDILAHTIFFTTLKGAQWGG